MSNEVRFKYIFKEEYNPKYVNGAYGGVSPSGEIIVNFYFERLPLPKADTYQLTNDGKIEGPVAQDPKDLSNLGIRYVQNGVILSLEHAKAIHQWLGTKIDEASELASQRVKSKE